MKISLPLYARILGWFFLNLLLLVVIFYGFFRFQFHFGLDSLLAGRAGERMEALGQLIGSELHDTPPDAWTAALDRFDTAYGVRFAIFRDDGLQTAGRRLDLPEDIRHALREVRNHPPRPPRLDRPPEFGLPPPGLENRPFPPAGPPRKMILRVGHPAKYWVLSSLPPGIPGHPGPLILALVSENLSAGGLIFDPTPWLAVGGGVVLFSVLFWWPLIRGITRAISQMTATTGEIASGHFDIRAPETRRDEIGTLGAAINRMAERLAGFIQGQKRFLGDTAHELVSPLARMEMALSILEQRASEKDGPYLADVHEEVRHMSDLVGELLSFSKASLGAAHVRLQPVALLALAKKTLKREAAHSVALDIAPDLQVQADPELLQRALGNIIRNALRHGGGGPVGIVATRSGNEVVTIVSDRGPGVPEPVLQQLFDPFFRLDASRDRATGGTGLGLAITKTCIEACGGHVSCRNRQPHGLEIEITLAVVL